MSSEVQKRVVKVSKEEADLFHNHHFGEIYNLTFSLLQKFFPKMKVEVKPGSIIVVDNFTIGPCIMEEESIGAIRELPGWHLDVSNYYDTVDGLADVDVCDLGESRSVNFIVMLLMKHLFEMEVKQYIEKFIYGQ